MNTLAIIQARVSSVRFPGKVLKKIQKKTLIELLIQRLKSSKKIDKIVVAIPDNLENIKLKNLVIKNNIDIFLGSENDLLDRYYKCAKFYEADNVIRITADCPLSDPGLIDKMHQEFMLEDLDCISNVNPPTFPDGLDITICKFAALEKAWKEASTKFDREHVMPYIYNSTCFRKKNFSNAQNLSNSRWTLDYEEDFTLIKNIFDSFSPRIDFSWQEIVEFEKNNPSLFEINKKYVRDEGSKMSSGQKLWIKAKKIIPGGSMLFSKRSENFLPNHWPAYFKKTKGCFIWDIDGKKFIDMSLMGVGTNTLGYSNDEVDEAVSEVIKNGNLSTLNCYEEVFLAEKLIEIHSWASMVRFARSGGEANSIAVRIARAASGKNQIAICGYHGWHDWYLAANLKSDNLKNHLLTGLSTIGVPESLKNSIFPFEYNNIDELEMIIKDNDIGVIKMEVSRNFDPKSGYLEKIRKLADLNNIVLIFDECSSGFRSTFGGLHLKYDVKPDIAIFGKTLGNGYAITAVLGRSDIMQFAEQTFISSTFWTERIGSAAGLKTLDVMKRLKSWNIIDSIGKEILTKWSDIADKHNVKIETFGIPALCSFKFISKNHLKYKTFLTQEMLKKGMLASNSVYSCIEHTKPILEEYFYNLDIIFEIISKCEEGLNIDDLLEGPICHDGFKRLN